MCSNLAPFRKLPYETNALAEYSTGKQFVSRKILKGKLKILLAEPTLPAPRTPVLPASFCSEVSADNKGVRMRM